MTRFEAAVISAYFGVLVGEPCYLLQYASKLLGRTVHDYELSCPQTLEELRRRSSGDFNRLEIKEGRICAIK